MRALAMLLLQTCSLLSLASFARSARLYPVQDQRVLLGESCAKGATPVWDQTLGGALGIMPGEDLIAIRDGRLDRVRAAALSCFTGECGANYLSIDLGQARGSGEIMAVAKASDFEGVEALRTSTSSAPGQCAAAFSKGTRAPLPEDSKLRTCSRISIGGEPSLILAAHGFAQENGWPELISEVEVLAPKSKARGFVEIDRGTGAITPFLAFKRDGQTHVLWRKAEGICCPQEITISDSTLGPDGLVFGERFKAGGQPCD